MCCEGGRGECISPQRRGEREGREGNAGASRGERGVRGEMRGPHAVTQRARRECGSLTRSARRARGRPGSSRNVATAQRGRNAYTAGSRSRWAHTEAQRPQRRSRCCVHLRDLRLKRIEGRRRRAPSCYPMHGNVRPGNDAFTFVVSLRSHHARKCIPLRPQNLPSGGHFSRTLAP